VVKTAVEIAAHQGHALTYMERPTVNVPMMSRVIGATFGFVFAGLGITMITFLWFGFDSDFGKPPLVFRIFGSLISLVFIVAGGSAGLAAVTANPRLLAGPAVAAGGAEPARPNLLATGPFTCPHCGAAMSGEASPHGDVKCAHCGAWFNIHGRG
jgi:hypothetical protein